MRTLSIVAALVVTVSLLALPGVLAGEAFHGPLDTTPPEILSVEPAAPVLVEERVFHVRFSEAMNTSVENATHLILGAAEIATVSSWNESGTLLAISLAPETHLEWESNYTLVLTTAMTDLAGNALTANYTHAFLTQEIPVVPTPPAPVAPWIVIVLALVILAVVFLAVYPAKRA